MTSEVVVYGASDDLIEVTGDLDAEFGVYHDAGGGVYLALSNGVLLKIRYDGDWNIRLAAPTAEATVEVQSAHNHGHAFAPDYSDVAVVRSATEPIWAVIAEESLSIAGDQVVSND